MKSNIEKMKHPAYCGFDCGNCPVFQATERADDAMRIELADKFSTSDRRLELSDINCTGCRSDLPSGHEFCRACNFRLCARGRGVSICGECEEYPCNEIERRFPKGCESREILDSVAEEK